MKLENKSETQVVLIGAGIMSATLAVILKRLNPAIKITLYEKLDIISGESSDALNNAGTGHSGYCELNYTPELEDGTIDINKAVNVATEFNHSLEFWAYLVSTGFIKEPDQFIHSVAHMSFVNGEDNVDFLRKRWETMKLHPLFEDMKYSEDHEQIKDWIPLMMQGRDENEKIAVTRMDAGCDVNYGDLTRQYLMNLVFEGSIALHVAHEVRDIVKTGDQWKVITKNLTNGKKNEKTADFVFIGAGGGAIQLLDKTGIPEAAGYGGFPVSGEWLICKNPEVINQHHAKVYGKSKVGAPPMSVPHLDTRVIDGEHQLLFGPFAGFSTKFLKNGSYWDLPLSIDFKNLKPMLSAGLHNLPLTRYLIEQVRQSKEDKVAALKEFFPEVNGDFWEEHIAGQRVQIIKKDEKEGGILQFGTEVVHSRDGSVAALLGASPGASTAVNIMLNLLEKCFPGNINDWEPKLKEMIPSYKNKDIDREFYIESRKRSAHLLELTAWEEALPHS